MSENEHDEFLERLREKAALKLLFLPHAVRQMNRPERMITPEEVREVVLKGELLENYPDDVRGHSCLLLGFGVDGRAIHVVCAPKEDYLAIVTAYIPTPERWSSDFRKRKAP